MIVQTLCRSQWIKGRKMSKRKRIERIKVHKRLITCDRRVLPVYERYGVRTQLLP